MCFYAEKLQTISGSGCANLKPRSSSCNTDTCGRNMRWGFHIHKVWHDVRGEDEFMRCTVRYNYQLHTSSHTQQTWQNNHVPGSQRCRLSDMRMKQSCVAMIHTCDVLSHRSPFLGTVSATIRKSKILRNGADLLMQLSKSMFIQLTKAPELRFSPCEVVHMTSSLDTNHHIFLIRACMKLEKYTLAFKGLGF